MENRTTVSVKTSTRDMLAALGSKDDDFDKIIRKLIVAWNESK